MNDKKRINIPAIAAIIFIALICLIFLPAHANGTGEKPGEPGTLKWVFQANDRLSTPAIGEDGTIYVTSYGKGALLAINPDGTEKWRFDMFESPYNQALRVSVDKNNTVYFGGRDGNLYAVNPDGTLKWVFTGKDFMSAGPSIGEDGTIYIGDGGQFYAINPDGTEKWRLQTEGVSLPVIGSDGTIYFIADENLLAINPDGTQKWSSKIGRERISGLAIGEGDAVYIGVGMIENYVYIINPNDGSIRRKVPVNVSPLTPPIVGKNGTIYIGIHGMEKEEHIRLFAVNPNGTHKWSFATVGRLARTPLMGDDGTIYVGCLRGFFYAVNPDGTEKWRLELGEPVIEGNPVIGYDGTIYVACWENLYAIRSDSGGLATDAPWPKYQRDYRNSGRYQEIGD